MLVGVVYNEEMCAHEGQKGHPEQPARITSIWEAFTKSELADKCVRVPARRATLEELSTVHSANHVKNICCLSYMPYMKSTLDVLRTKYTQNSIYFNHKSFEAATWAAGSVVELSLKVARGEVASGAAIVRPPGHHACPNVAMGFCFFNNVAVAARILSGAKVGEQQMIDAARKVLVVDWDVHHGNGTQLTFFRDKQVLYFSVHRFDGGEFYPGSYGESRENLLYENGDVDKVGEGDGVGFNVNVPWPGKGFGDADYIAVWKHLLLPIGESFKPDIVLVSAGFDAAEGDEMGECNLTPEGYATLTRMLKTLAGGKVVLALEGGYNLEATSRSFVACLRALTDTSVADLPAGKPSQATWEVITKVRQVQSQYWPALTATRPLVVNLNIRPPRGWVWYATYGSNMWPARLNCYIQGGKVEGAHKSNPGLRDKTLPKDNVWLTFNHRVFFGRKHSNTWGPGGVAFLNPMESQDKAVFRAYKITYEQFNGIFAQENSLDPAKQAGPICPEVLTALRDPPNFIECIKDVNVWYRAVLYLGEYSDLPVLTITCPPSDVEKYISGELPTCEPSESYRKTILTGLRDYPALDEASGKKYLDKVTYKVPFKPQPAVTVLTPPPSTPPQPSQLAVALFDSPSLTDSVRRDLTHRKRKNTLRRS